MTSDDLNFEKKKLSQGPYKTKDTLHCDLLPTIQEIVINKARRGVGQFLSEVRFDSAQLTNFFRFTFISNKVLAKTGLRKS